MSLLHDVDDGHGGSGVVAVVGAGAVGCYFGGMLARAGVPVVLIGRQALVDAVQADGLRLEAQTFDERVQVAASISLDAAERAGLVLFCVKTPDTESAARALERHVPPGTVVLSLQNGVDNVARIRAATSLEAVPAVVYVAAHMAAAGHVKHSGRGDLVIGGLARGASPAAHAEIDRLARIAAMFEAARVPCRISQDIEAELWHKLVMNCASNAISALARVPYGRVNADEGGRDVMRMVVDETLAVARASGVRLPSIDYHHAVHTLLEMFPTAFSSTAQDLMRGKLTEIDALNGYVARRGAELGVPTPVSRTLQALVTLAGG